MAARRVARPSLPLLTLALLPGTFRSAYPADPHDAYAALTSAGVRWPGAAILWVTIDGVDSRLMDGLPRALRASA